VTDLLDLFYLVVIASAVPTLLALWPLEVCGG